MEGYFSCEFLSIFNVYWNWIGNEEVVIGYWFDYFFVYCCEVVLVYSGVVFFEVDFYDEFFYGFRFYVVLFKGFYCFKVWVVLVEVFVFFDFFFCFGFVEDYVFD